MFSSRQKVRIVAPKIVQPDTGRWKWWVLLGAILLAVWSWYVFDYGRQRAGVDVGAINDDIAELEAIIDKQDKKIEQLRLESASHQRAAQIDKKAVLLARQNLMESQQEMAELKREADFLNSLLSDKAKKALLRLRQFTISSTATANSYRLKFTLVHLSKVGGSVKGKATLSIIGKKAGKAATLTLDKITDNKQKTMKMGFKNFQNFETTVTLPEGFTPERIKISADVDSKTLEDFEQTKPWQVAAN